MGSVEATESRSSLIVLRAASESDEAQPIRDGMYMTDGLRRLASTKSWTSAVSTDYESDEIMGSVSVTTDNGKAR